jgi:lipooligosaccharide transport system permease protein
VRLPGDVDLGMAAAVWRRNLTVYRHTWLFNILPNFFEPLLYLLGMGVGLGFYLREGMGGDDYLIFISPGLMAAAAMNGASFETTYNIFIKMTFARLYDAFLCTPCQLQDIAFGELLWAVTRALIYGCAFLVILLGFTVAGVPIVSGWGVLVLPLALALVGALFALIGQLFTAMVKIIDLYSYFYTLWLTPLFLFSGIFFPVERFPAGADIAWFTPLYHSVRLVRGLSQSRVGGEELVSLAWIAVASIALLWAVPRAMRRRMAS